jgi:predicted RNase H-like nuclease (RuvC/YqgF family)
MGNDGLERWLPFVGQAVMLIIAYYTYRLNRQKADGERLTRLEQENARLEREKDELQRKLDEREDQVMRLQRRIGMLLDQQDQQRRGGNDD